MLAAGFATSAGELAYDDVEGQLGATTIRAEQIQSFVDDNAAAIANAGRDSVELAPISSTRFRTAWCGISCDTFPTSSAPGIPDNSPISLTGSRFLTSSTARA